MVYDDHQNHYTSADNRQILHEGQKMKVIIVDTGDVYCLF